MSETTAKNTLVELGISIVVIREKKTIHVWQHLFLAPRARLFRQNDSTNTLTHPRRYDTIKIETHMEWVHGRVGILRQSVWIASANVFSICMTFNLMSNVFKP